MNTSFILYFSLLIFQVLSQTGRTSLDDFLGLFRIGRKVLFEVVNEQNKSPLRESKLQERIPKSRPFFCDVATSKSAQKPESVHQLKPGDIDVVAALGDSLTAGFGVTALNIFETVLLEERGKSFSIGGEGDWRNVTTLPNILKVFNPNLVGFSLKNSLSMDSESQLNVAEGNAISADIPYMARQLIKRIKSDKRININGDWKMVTIFIGANDFCTHICYLDDPFLSLENHKRDLIETLRILRNNLPRTFVNLIPPPNIRTLVELKITDSFCDITHLFECPCFFGSQFAAKRSILYKVMVQWQELDVKIGNLPEFDTDDFTAVVQPFTLNYTFPVVSGNVADLRYFAPDCFHFSQRMHARVANDLWNSIMEPVGNKPWDGQELFKKFKCPSSERPYIFTRRNSIS